MPTLAGWQSGHAAACKAVYAGSIPTPASIKIQKLSECRRILGQSETTRCSRLSSRGRWFTDPKLGISEFGVGVHLLCLLVCISITNVFQPRFEARLPMHLLVRAGSTTLPISPRDKGTLEAEQKGWG